MPAGGTKLATSAASACGSQFSWQSTKFPHQLHITYYTCIAKPITQKLRQDHKRLRVYCWVMTQGKAGDETWWG